MIDCFVVGSGWFIGAVCRYLIGLIPINERCDFPIKTLIVNIIGSFIIGIIVALAVHKNSLNPKIILFIKVGICGGFTTFSSFALETGDLISKGKVYLALLYIILSIVAGLLAVYLGQEIIRRVWDYE